MFYPNSFGTVFSIDALQMQKMRQHWTVLPLDYNQSMLHTVLHDNKATQLTAMSPALKIKSYERY